MANAPGGVQRLREMILQLAVMGKLAEQDPEDEPAEKLLKRIVKKKALLVASKKKVVPNKEKQSFSAPLPKGWSSCALGDLVLTITGGGTPSKAKKSYWDGNIPWASVKDLKDFKYLDYTQDTISKEGLNDSTSNLIPIGRYIVCTRMGLGKSVINRIETSINQDLKALEIPSEIDIEFFHILYRTRRIKGSGMTVKGIKQVELLALPSILPPLQEQKRIVTKVDQLMSLCDQLEAQKHERSKLIKNTRISALEALTEASGGDELKTAWDRVEKNLAMLFDAPEDVEDLKKCILQNAVMGKLVAQNPDDEPASELLKKIVEEKAELISKKRRFAKLKDVTSTKKLPDNWEWILLEDLLAGSDSGWSPKCKSVSRQGNKWGILKVSAVTWGKYNPKENKELPSNLKPRMEFEVKPNDFLLSRANTSELVAKSVVVPSNAPNNLLMSDKIVRLAFLDDRFKVWVNFVNNSDAARKYYISNATGTSDSMKNVSRKVIHELEIPFPPFEEQKRIVKKLKTLLPLCNTLQTQLETSQKIAEQLAKSVVENITGISTEKPEEMRTT